VEFADDGADSRDVGVCREEVESWHHGHVVGDELSDKRIVDAVYCLRRVGQNIDAALHGDSGPFHVGGMGEDELTVAVRGLDGSLSDVELHGKDLGGGYVGAGKELDDIGAEFGVAVDEGGGFGGSGGLSQFGADLGGKTVEVERDSVRGIERDTGGVDVRAKDLPALDALAQGKGAVGEGAGVDYGNKAGVSEHLLELEGKLFRGLMGGVNPLRLHEVNVVVPEAGEDDAVVAGQGGKAGWDGEVLAYGGDLSATDENGRVGCRLSFWGGVDRRIRDGQILRLYGAGGEGDEGKKDKLHRCHITARM
jgi:hypothetical protein